MLRLGVLGLGGRWPRFREAARALRGQVRVVAVWDDVPARAEREAEALRCRAAGGAVELLGRDDVDAVLLPGGPWSGLWPLERAVAANKPALCAVSPLAEEGAFDKLGAAAVQLALWPALEVLAEAAAERFGEALGEVALVRASWSRVGEEVDVLQAPAALALLAACGDLLGGEALGVTAVQPSPGYATVVVEAAGGVAQLSLFAGPAGVGGCRFEVEGEDGGLRAALPRRLTWSGAEGQQAVRLPAVPAELLVLDRFAETARQGGVTGETVDRAHRALGWLRAARRSAAEGRRVALGAVGGR